MKNIILILIGLFVCLTLNGQKTLKDTSEICIPYKVAQKILLDLTDYDRLKDISKLENKEIYNLNNKIMFLEKTNQTWGEKDSLNGVTIKEINKKYTIVEDQNNELRKDVKKLKVKNTVIEIVGSALLITISIFSILK